MANAAERLLRRYYDDVWVGGRVEALDALLAPDYRDHDPPPGFGADRAEAHRFAATFLAGLQRPTLDSVALVATGDAAAAHWRLAWTQDGRRLIMRDTDLIRVRGGRIAEIFHVEKTARPA